MICTELGRVVYDRIKHPFKQRDVVRILYRFLEEDLGWFYHLNRGKSAGKILVEAWEELELDDSAFLDFAIGLIWILLDELRKKMQSWMWARLGVIVRAFFPAPRRRR